MKINFRVKSNILIKCVLGIVGFNFPRLHPIREEKEGQDIDEGCKRLIQNSVILFNYLILTQKLQLETNPEKQQEMIKIITTGSPQCWSHINFLGEYNFNEEDNSDTLELNMSQIKDFKLDRIMGHKNLELLADIQD